MRKALILFILVSHLAFGQTEVDEGERSPKIGLSALVQSNQFGILLPIWLDGNTVLVPSVEVAYAQTIGLDLGVGINFREYLREGKVRPYLAPGIGVLMAFPESDDDVVEDPPNPVDFVVSLGVGGEYFFSENFSAAVQIGINGSISDEDSNRFGNPGNFNLNTGAALLVNVYF
jgi:hypothetical protein